MLYVACELNGNAVVAFVDSGAQKTVIGNTLAQKIGLLKRKNRKINIKNQNTKKSRKINIKKNKFKLYFPIFIQRLSRLVDSRCRGVATGVGTSEIVGRVHVAQLKIGFYFRLCRRQLIQKIKKESKTIKLSFLRLKRAQRS